jgi:hypothetical protein
MFCTTAWSQPTGFRDFASFIVGTAKSASVQRTPYPALAFLFLGQDQGKANAFYLEFVRDNPYNLVLFLAWFVLHAIITDIWFAIFGDLFGSLVLHINVGLLALFSGAMMGDAVRLRYLLRMAMRWDEGMKAVRDSLSSRRLPTNPTEKL